MFFIFFARSVVPCFFVRAFRARGCFGFLVRAFFLFYWMASGAKRRGAPRGKITSPGSGGLGAVKGPQEAF